VKSCPGLCLLLIPLCSLSHHREAFWRKCLCSLHLFLPPGHISSTTAWPDCLTEVTHLDVAKSLYSWVLISFTSPLHHSCLFPEKIPVLPAALSGNPIVTYSASLSKRCSGW
jgi:hypothetical protein